MTNARRAATMAVDRLGAEDILSVVSYDDRVEVDVPATKVLDRSDVQVAHRAADALAARPRSMRRC